MVKMSLTRKEFLKSLLGIPLFFGSKKYLPENKPKPIEEEIRKETNTMSPGATASTAYCCSFEH